MSAARVRAQAGNGRGEHSSFSLHARVPVLCMELIGENVNGLFAQETVMYCKDVDFGLLRLWEKLCLTEVQRCLSSTPPQLTTALWGGVDSSMLGCSYL